MDLRQDVAKEKEITVSEMDKYIRIRNSVKILDRFPKANNAIIIIIYYLSHVVVKYKT